MAEIALISISDSKVTKLADEGNKSAKRIIKLTEKPAKFLATIQVAITLSGFMASAFAAENFSDKIVDLIVSRGFTALPPATIDLIAVIVITFILSYFTLVFGELVPKRVAMKKAEQIALALSGVVTFVSVAFAPLVWLLTASTNGILRLMGIDPDLKMRK